MHFTTVAASAITLLASAASAEDVQMQVNYYSDECKSVIGEINVTWAVSMYRQDYDCRNHNEGRFVNIAHCYNKSGCKCNFFQGKDCAGSIVEVYDDHKCGVGAQDFQSFACYYY